MIEMHLHPSDHGLIRFGTSPMQETVLSLWALGNPMHRAWEEWARPVIEALDLHWLPLLCSTGSWVPDFLTPAPTRRTMDFHDELKALGTTPPQKVRANVAAAWEGTALPYGMRPLVDDPERILPEVVDELKEYHEAVIEPVWPRVHGLLEADLDHRAHKITTGGLVAVFADLHDRVAYRGDRIELTMPWDCKHYLHGIGVLLVPSAFLWPKLATVPDPPNQPMITYPARGIGDLWSGLRTEPAEEPAAAALLGRSRALMLAQLDLPMTTTQLARRMGLSAGAVSEHLGILRRSDLVTSHRTGRQVFYQRTMLASALLRQAS